MYNKLFRKILTSSIWLAPTPTRIVWITLLAAMDEDGFAQFSAIGNLAVTARVTVEEANEAIECFIRPDPESGNPENEGRRVEKVPGGYMILNSEAHRGLRNRVLQREQTRIRVAKYRDKLRGNTKALHQALPTVTPLPYTESEAETITTLSSKLDDAREILVFLNEKTGKRYPPVKSNLEIIKARLAEGYTAKQIHQVIARKFSQWSADEKMAVYLRPKTLFNRTNFANYVGELVL